ncbi:eukaryotic translation initiation factor 4 gamma 1-like isoform X2 [Thrips palmi]|uniref:Eukaryotic translation initiation factor 4 gamma 1-like isoform X2 n=1 Tax=Thrips palmi TaxID=161013 RepID=A0A6P8ZL46_THRPL|nr:eukaryotic translation initiation factor 4 gamma 1-like isoform X2 [Thrips palmi]
MDPRLACQQGPSDDLTNHLGYGSDMSMNQEMWSHGNYEEFYPGEGGGDVYHVTSTYPPQGGGGPSGGPSGGPQMRVGINAMGMPVQGVQGVQGAQQQGSHPGHAGGPAPTSTPPQPDMSKSLHLQGQGQIQGSMIPFQVQNASRQTTQNYNFQPRTTATRMPNRNQQAFYPNMANSQQLVAGQHYGIMPNLVMYPRGAGMNSAGHQPTLGYPNQQQQYYIPTNMPGAGGLFYATPMIRTAPSGVNISGPPQTQQSLQTAAPHGPVQTPNIPVSGAIMPIVSPSAPSGGNAVPPAQPKRRKHALIIVDPNSGKDVVEEMEKEASASGSSSNRETPQPESSAATNHNVAAEFAERVGKAASEDSTPSAPTQPPDLSQNMGSVNGPAASPAEAAPDATLSQSSYLEDSSSIGNTWNKGGHKGPGAGPVPVPVEDGTPVFLYSPVIPHNFSAKSIEEMYPSSNVSIVMHHSSMVPTRPAQLANSSLALSETTPVVSANINAPSVEVYRGRNAQQSPSGNTGTHPSPQRRKRQENAAAVSSSNASTTPSASSTESPSHVAEAKKKGSPTPAGGAQSVGPAKAQPGAVQKDAKGGKGAKAPAPKDAPKEVLKDAPKEADKTPLVEPAKGKSPPASQATTPAAAKPAAAAAPAAPAAAPAGASTPAPAAADAKADKASKATPTPKPAVPEPAAESEGKGAGRHKGKKMRDSSAKGAEKEGSDVEAASEAALPEESCSTPASTPTPSEAAAGSSPVAATTPEAEAEGDAVSKTASPTPAATPVTSVPEPAAAATPAEPAEGAVAPQTEDLPEAVDAATPATTAPSAPTVTVPAPTPAAVNLFAPFALPSPPVIIPRAVKEVKEVEVDDKVSSRNDENAKVSKDDAAGDKKRAYAPEQWSPLNPDGKKKYDRSFLMDLRNDPQSQKKPDGLPEMEVVLKESNKKAMQNNFNNDFSPAGFVRSSGSRGPPPQRKSQQGKPKSGKPPLIHVTLSLREDVKLHETENAWKPGVLVAGSKESDEEEAKTQDLYKKVRGVLNKLTPQKFDTLVGQVQALPINTPERLKGVIDLVFDKAVDEPNFSVAYAKMCNELKSKEIQNNSFRKILITRCQQEFEKNKDAETNNKDKKIKEIESEPDPEKRKELTLMYEEEERKIRMKSVGNIRFIGELYKLGMLTGPIMLRCVSDLLRKEDEESYECLCKLLTTIGKKLEMELTQGGQGDVLSSYFIKMKELADKGRKGKNVSSRVRFMLQDCIDLRSNKWVPRRDDSNPKTMDEIHREAERETVEMNIALAQQGTPRKDDRGMNRGMGGGGGGMDKRGGRGGPAADDGGWKNVQTRSRPLDVNKMAKGIIQSTEIATLGSPNQFSKWGGGSGNSASRDPKAISSRPGPVVTTGNPFSALEKTSVFNNAERKPSGSSSKDRSMGDRNSGSRSSSQHRTSSQPASRDSSQARGKLEEERRSRVPTPTSVSEISPSEQPTSNAKDANGGPVCKLRRLEEGEELERISKNLVDEYLSHRKLEDATLAVQDYFDWTNIASFTREALASMLDRVVVQDHILVGKFLGHLIQINQMRKEDFNAGFSQILELCPDFIVDIPKLWTHVGALLAGILLIEAVTFKDLAEPLVVLKGSKEAGLLLKNIMQVLDKEKGSSWIKDNWNKCGATWCDFLEEKDVSDFLKENNNLESFSGGALASNTEMTQEEIQNKLLDFLNSNETFDGIQGWIKSNVGDRTNEPAFIRALMTAICRNCLQEAQPSNKLTLNEEKLSQDKLLQRYLENKEDLELQCLYAVQALVTQLEHPQGLIVSIFNALWEYNVISTDAFLAWFKSDDPQETEGRGVCRSSLASFLTLLSETEEDEEHP